MKAVKKKWSVECGKIRILFAVFTALLIVLLWCRTACAQEENEIWERLQGQLDALELGRAEELYMQYGNAGFCDTVKAIFEGKYEAGGTTRALLGLILPEVAVCDRYIYAAVSFGCRNRRGGKSGEDRAFFRHYRQHCLRGVCPYIFQRISISVQTGGTGCGFP